MTPQVRESEQPVAVAAEAKKAPFVAFFKPAQPITEPEAENDNTQPKTRHGILAKRRKRWARLSNRH